MKMKTILINIFDSNMVRNILRTNILKTILDGESVSRVVILTHHSKIEEYKKEFNDKKIVFDIYPSNLPSRTELFWWFVVRHTIHNKNVRFKINELYDRAPGSYLSRFSKYILALFSYYLTYIKFVENIVRRITINVYNEKNFDSLIDKYKPDIVFCPSIFGNNDVRLLKNCKKNGIYTIGMIKSWDNLLGKDPMLIWPDKLIVHNEIIKSLAIKMHKYPESDMFVSGIPQFDVYHDENFVFSKKDFFNKYGLDINKRLITYTAMGGWISIYEKEIIKMISTIISSNSLKYECQLLVRLHPAYLSDDIELLKIPDIKIVRPGISNFEKNPLSVDFEFREDDTKDLASVCKWSDVIINSGSTMTIDAACFNTPIVNIAFDGEVKKVKYSRSAKRLIDKDHYQQIVNTGGVRVVYNKNDFLSSLNSYLENPNLDQQGRLRIVREQCYKLDGMSGERIGKYILENINNIK